jgi:hypothetical protein
MYINFPNVFLDVGVFCCCYFFWGWVLVLPGCFWIISWRPVQEGVGRGLGVYESLYLFSELFVINFSEYILIVSYTIPPKIPLPSGLKLPEVHLQFWSNKNKTTSQKNKNKLFYYICNTFKTFSLY